jgi:DNA-damage-inducible protein J
MAQSDILHARIGVALKREAESILKTLGVSRTEALRMFYAQIVLHRGLPFELKIPNQTTLDSIASTDRGEDIERFEHLDLLLKDLEI